MDTGAYIGWKQWHSEQFAAVAPGTHFYFDQIFGRRPGKMGKVLEIGYGNGALLGYLRARGHAVVGVEINEPLVTRANECGYTAYQGAAWAIAELQPQHFDLIVAFDVAEHMSYEELRIFFAWARDHLNEGGKLYLRFPEGASPFGLANQNGDFTHVTSLSLPKIEALCAGSRTELVSYSDDVLSSNKLCAFGPAGKLILLLLQGYAAALKGMLKLILYPLATSLRLGTNSIAVITARKAVDEEQTGRS
ncbi:MAG: class I SAM-dependent methyltransferase [Gammaproteobacteria bacterium]